MVHRIVRGRLIVPFPLFGRRAWCTVGSDVLPTVSQRLRSGGRSVRLLGLGRVVNDDDLLGQTILVE